MKKIFSLYSVFLIPIITFGQSTLNDTLVTQLSFIREADQKYRGQLELYQHKYGWESEEMQNLLRNLKQTDSLNLNSIEAIVHKYGWELK